MKPKAIAIKTSPPKTWSKNVGAIGKTGISRKKEDKKGVMYQRAASAVPHPRIAPKIP